MKTVAEVLNQIPEKLRCPKFLRVERLQLGVFGQNRALRYSGLEFSLDNDFGLDLRAVPLIAWDLTDSAQHYDRERFLFFGEKTSERKHALVEYTMFASLCGLLWDAVATELSTQLYGKIPVVRTLEEHSSIQLELEPINISFQRSSATPLVANFGMSLPSQERTQTSERLFASVPPEQETESELQHVGHPVQPPEAEEIMDGFERLLSSLFIRVVENRRLAAALAPTE